MGSEVKKILKTCSTCKETFSSLRDLIQHENGHRPKPLDKHWSLVPSWPLVRNRSTPFQVAHVPWLQYPAEIDEITSQIDPQASQDQPSELASQIDIQDIQDQSSELVTTTPSKLQSEENDQDSTSDNTTTNLAPESNYRQSKSAPCQTKILFASSIIKKNSCQKPNDSLIINNRWICEYCLGDYPTQKVMARHQLGSHYGTDAKPRYYCNKCNPRGRKSYMTYQEFRQHINSLHGGMDAVKEIQKSDIGKTDDIDATNSSETRSTSGFLCKYCLGYQCSLRALGQHQRAMHRSEASILTYFCRECPQRRIYSTRDKFFAHMVKRHGYRTQQDGDGNLNCFPPQAETTETRKPNQNNVIKRKNTTFCRFCFKEISGEVTHLRRHHLDGKYSCSICTTKNRFSFRIFANEEEFRAHLISDHGLSIDFIESALNGADDNGYPIKKKRKNRSGSKRKKNLGTSKLKIRKPKSSAPRTDQGNRLPENTIIKAEPIDPDDQESVIPDFISSAWTTVIKTELNTDTSDIEGIKIEIEDLNYEGGDQLDQAWKPSDPLPQLFEESSGSSNYGNDR